MRYADNVVVPGLPALYNKRKNAIIIADLHLGFESDAAREGMYLPRLQLKKSLDLIETLHGQTGARMLVVDGDLKHTFEKLTMQEREEVSKFLAKAKDLFSEIVLVRGNHDTFVTRITSRFDVSVVEEFRLDDETLLVHGHKLFEDIERVEGYIIIGHEHPAVKVSDELGSIAKYPCFLSMPLENSKARLVILPAAGYYQTGNPVGLDREAYLSPIVRRFGVVENAVPIVFEPGHSAFEFPRLGDMRDFLEGGVRF